MGKGPAAETGHTVARASLRHPSEELQRPPDQLSSQTPLGPSPLSPIPLCLTPPWPGSSLGPDLGSQTTFTRTHRDLSEI